jgi:hypothetical protein
MALPVVSVVSERLLSCLHHVMTLLPRLGTESDAATLRGRTSLARLARLQVLLLLLMYLLSLWLLLLPVLLVTLMATDSHDARTS